MTFNWLRYFLLTGLCLFAAGGLAKASELGDMISADEEGTNVLQLLKLNPGMINDRDASNNCTPLHYAAQYDRTNVVKWLIKHKADVNATSNAGNTPLHLTKSGEIARMLIKAGADLHKQDDWNKTPLQRAAQLHRKEVCDAILASGFDVDLTSALWLGKRDEAKKIIKRHPEQVKWVDPDTDLWGNTSPLGIAAGNGDVEMVKLLLAGGAPVNAETACPGAAPMTPLCNAVWGGHVDTAELLCKAGANCNVSGGKHYAHLLDFAQEHSDPPMIDVLIKYGGRFTEPAPAAK